MNSQTFHKTPISFWLLLAAAVIIAELCFIYLALETNTSLYSQPGRTTSLETAQK